MNTSQLKNFAIGVFVIIAIVIFGGILFYLRPTVGDQGQTIHVRFTNIDKVNVGTRVTFAGQPVGEVTAIHEINDARIDTHDGQVFIFELIIKVDSSIYIYTTDQVSVRTSGLLGERSVAITPVPARPGQPFQRVTSKDVMYAESTGSVEETFSEITRLSNKVEGVVDNIKEATDVMKKGKVWDNFSKMVDNLADVSAALDEPELLNKTINNIHRFSEKLANISDRFDATWDHVEHSAVHLATASSKFVDITQTTHDVIIDVQAGKGSIGRLLVNDDFYLQIKAIIHKAEVLMDDINHYGILFQNDKRWQRVRARRANLLSELCTPQEFQNFFNDEIDQISTSLARVSWVMQEASSDGCCEDAILTPQFESVFADLFRRVQNLEDTIQLYNDQIDDLKNCECR